MQQFLEIDVQNALIGAYQTYESDGLLLARAIKELEATVHSTQRYETPYASLNLVDDRAMHDHIAHEAEKVRNKKIDMLIVIGIGGSDLGAMAVHDFLVGLSSSYCPDVWWVDTIEPVQSYHYTQRLQQIIKAGEKVHIVVITKSGMTTETIVNAQLLITVIMKAYPMHYKDMVTIITDAHSPLYHVAKKHGYHVVTIPPKVGGRYSVLSAAGLFPLAVLGYDIYALCKGAYDMRNRCLIYTVPENPAALSALYIYRAYQEGVVIHDTFVGCVRLTTYGAWYRQLLGESIGKRKNIYDETVFIGITPTVSVATTDLHAVAQLYLDGPYDKITTFITITTWPADVEIPTLQEFSSLVPFLHQQKISTVLAAIMTGVMRAYKDDHRPYISLSLPEISAYYIGQLLQLKMMEIMYLGHLLDVNPFDQPAVERYKHNTREILSHE